MDVLARALPQLRPVASPLARDRPGRGAAAVRRPGRARPRQDAETFEQERNRFGFFGRVSTREEDPWDAGWWRYRIPGLGQVDFRRYVDTLYEGGFDGVLSVEHEDPVWGGTRSSSRPGCGSPTRTCAGWWSHDEGPRGPQPRQGVSGRQGARRGRPRRPRAEVHCLLGPNGAGKVDAHQVRPAQLEPTSGEILFLGEPLPGAIRPAR